MIRDKTKKKYKKMIKTKINSNKMNEDHIRYKN